MELHGNVEALSPKEIVSRFEDTMSRASEGSGSPEAEITQIWEKAALQRKRTS